MRISNYGLFPAAAAIVCVAGASALAQGDKAPAAAKQVDEQAKTILTESAAAIKAMTGITYTATRSLDGQAQFTMKTEGQVKFVRDAASPASSALWIKGRMQFPMQDERDVLVAFSQGLAAWTDFRTNTVLEKKAVASDAAPDVNRVRQQLVPEAFFEREPFEKALRSPEITVVGVEDVNGEKCQVVKTWNAPSQRGTNLYISMNDRLPRRIEAISGLKGAEAGKASFTLNIKDLKPAPDLKAADMKVETPAGFQRHAEEGKKPDATPTNPMPLPHPPGAQAPAGDAAKPAAAAPPPPKPAGVVGGFAPGTVAPAWMLRDSNDKEQTLASHAGKVVVLGFWGPLFSQSKGANQTLDEVAKATTGKNVAVYSVVCRDPGKRAAKLMKDWSVNVPLLLDGDQTAKDYQVQGYPSFAVINGEGKIAAFAQGATGKDDLMKAVEKAMGGK